MAGSSHSARRQSLVPPTQPSSRAKPRHYPVRLRDALRVISRASTPGTEELPTRSVHYVKKSPGTYSSSLTAYGGRSGVGSISVCFFCSAVSLHPMTPPVAWPFILRANSLCTQGVSGKGYWAPKSRQGDPFLQVNLKMAVLCRCETRGYVRCSGLTQCCVCSLNIAEGSPSTRSQNKAVCRTHRQSTCAFPNTTLVACFIRKCTCTRIVTRITYQILYLVS